MSRVIFWLKLKKPIMTLAPMAEINDAAFRTICKEFGADVVYSEMISASALYYDSKKTMEMLRMTKKEHPVVFQLFGKEPEHFRKAAKIVEKAGADGIDINFGCPAKKVVKNQEGVVLMRDFALSKKIIQAVLESVKVPVSVKIRAGIEANKHECRSELTRMQKEGAAPGKIPPSPPLEKGETEALYLSKGKAVLEQLSFRAKRLPEQAGRGVEESFDAQNRDMPVQKIPPHPLCSVSSKVGRDDRKGDLAGIKNGKITALDFVNNIRDLPISAIMIHGRTYSQGFSEKPDYEIIKSVVDLVGDKIIVLGNGGINTPKDACEMLEKTGAHGIGLARGVLGRPWLFREIKEVLYGRDAKFCVSTERANGIDEIKKIVLRHAKLAYKIKGDRGIIELRKYLLWYVKGLENARELREGFTRVETIEDIKRVLKDI